MSKRNWKIQNFQHLLIKDVAKKKVKSTSLRYEIDWRQSDRGQIAPTILANRDDANSHATATAESMMMISFFQARFRQKTHRTGPATSIAFKTHVDGARGGIASSPRIVFFLLVARQLRFPSKRRRRRRGRSIM